MKMEMRRERERVALFLFPVLKKKNSSSHHHPTLSLLSSFFQTHAAPV